MYSFFIKPCSGSITRWNPNFKYHLAYLLYVLLKKKYIIIIGNKGFFTCAENHFTDFEKSFFKKNALKNLKLKIINNPLKFSFVISEAEEILNKIQDPKLTID